MTKPLSLLIVNDFKLLRESWAYIFSRDERFIIAGAATDMREALQQVITLKPDVVLLDFNRLAKDTVETARKIRLISPDTIIICLTMVGMPSYANRLMEIGKVGYLSKNASLEELTDAIMKVKMGSFYLSPEIAGIVCPDLNDAERPVLQLTQLSKREKEVVECIRQGLSSREIALLLDLSIKTIEVHRYNILRKLKIKNTAALVNLSNKFDL